MFMLLQLALALLSFGSVFIGQPRFDLDFYWWRVAGFVAIFLGIGLFAWARKSVIFTGPYQYVRHPLYLAEIFIFVGWWWVWAAVYSFYFGMFILAIIWLQAWLEEKLLLVPKYGAKYLEYRQQTGMFWIK